MELRLALLSYPQDQQGSLDTVIRRLGLKFEHQKPSAQKEAPLPSALDPKLISVEAYTQKVLAANPQTAAGMSELMKARLLTGKISPELRRAVLASMQRPDFPGLVAAITADLDTKGSGGFGSVQIHLKLLRSQMDELAKAKPYLLNEEKFVNAYLPRLRPGDDTDWRNDPKLRAAYLDDLWQFASPLAPVFNSLKTNVLYYRLALDQSQGVYDHDRFLTYVKLPRSCSYMRPEWLQNKANHDYNAGLNVDYSSVSALPQVGDDTALVRDFLMHFLAAAPDYKEFEPYLADEFLKEVFAEAKLVGGAGEEQKYFSLLTAERYAALKDRVDVDFDATNKRIFAPSDAVSLKVNLKNVPKLIVKVYQISTVQYYRSTLNELGPDVDLDGLVANDEKVINYAQPPLVRHAETLDLPLPKGRGAWVVELIGNGKSSRALVLKGKLSCLQRDSAAGQVFTVTDEAGKKVPDAVIYLGARQYTPGKDGCITIPYTTDARGEKLVLAQGDFASLAAFNHSAEHYELSCDFLLDRESLLPGMKATAVIWPTLKVNGQVASLKLLEEPMVELAFTDLEGVRTVKQIRDLKLEDGRDITADFTMPPRLQSMTARLSAKVQNLSLAKKEDLSQSWERNFAGIANSMVVDDLYLMHVDGKYVLEVRDRNAQPRADRPVTLTINRSDFNEPIVQTLKTGKDGRIDLGTLDGITNVLAGLGDGGWGSWRLPQDRAAQADAVHGSAAAGVRIPYMGKAAKVTPDVFSLLEVRAGTFVADRLANLKLQDGFLVLQDLPAGDYSLWVKDSGQMLTVRLSGGELQEGYLVSPVRSLQLKYPAPLQISSMQAGKDSIVVQLANAGKLTRVYVLATRYVPTSPLGFAGQLPGPEALGRTPTDSSYVSGRDIGQEYRYILERKYAAKFPGNMLTRPGLLLNPWSREEVATPTRNDEMLKSLAQKLDVPLAALIAHDAMIVTQPAAPAVIGETGSSMDFLAQNAVVLANLVPDDKGRVTIARKDLGDHQQVQVLATDMQEAVYREISLAEPAAKFVDLRLAKTPLTGDAHMIESRKVSVLKAGEQLTLDLSADAQFETYDTVGKALGLFVMLTQDRQLIDFAFIADWPSLTDAQKREKYSKYECHELNFFLSRKDPKFFEQVAAPFIRNKKDKTFMDLYLLGDDVSKFAQPVEFQKLAMMERVLLAQRIVDQQAAVNGYFKDYLEACPPDPQRQDILFKTALRGSQTDTGRAYDIKDLITRVPNFSSPRINLSGNAGNEENIPTMGGALFNTGTADENIPTKRGGRGGGGGGLYADGAAAPATALPPLPPVDRTTNGAADLDASYSWQAKVDSSNSGKVIEKQMELAKSQTEALRGDLEARTRADIRQLYRNVDVTKEWVESNFYHLPRGQSPAAVSYLFWRDVAANKGGAVLTGNFADACGSFSEAMFALALLDLPFDAPKHESSAKDNVLTIKAAGPMLVFHKQYTAAQPAKAKLPVTVSQNYFRNDDREGYEDGEQFDKFVTDEFIAGVVYGCQVVLTNPTSTPQRLDMVLQVPKGAVPVGGAFYVRDVHVELAPFSTQKLEHFFYFPSPGEFEAYGVQVTRKGQLTAWAQNAKLKVVEQPSRIDRTAWAYISASGTDDEVLDFLRKGNLMRVNLEDILWRMQDKGFYAKAIEVLKARQEFCSQAWAYGLKHNDVPAIRQYLLATTLPAELAQIDSPLLTVDAMKDAAPLATDGGGVYELVEFAPLVNPRAHRLGKDRTILNKGLFAQYERMLRVWSLRPAMSDEDLLAASYYLLLQDRLEEAIATFAKVKRDNLATKVQYDYFQAYADFCKEDVKAARRTAEAYANYPVDRWRTLFADVLGQCDEIEGKGPSISNLVSATGPATVAAGGAPASAAGGAASRPADKSDDAQARQQAQAGTEPALDFKIEGARLTLSYQNLSQVRVNYYPMDVELLFSKSPFSQGSASAGFIKPRSSEVVDLPAKAAAKEIELPKDFQSSNVMVEVVAGGIRLARPYLSSSLAVQMMENYGQLRVTSSKDGAAQVKVYVKVYARMADGSVRFHKDGYTDLRGRFDYATLSGAQIGQVSRFAILVLSESQGAVIKETNPPQR